eukprot:TRINITY_DN12453_c0_g9_i5.p1 TRINITY_DN12453_c0_g9~~TRINITY_DN12453_c0_g9_i5.p1  ORF type:complete len:655 (+),score=152.14 TRINITY_DN12453_c0_g9_i5:1424-3388(+)
MAAKPKLYEFDDDGLPKLDDLSHDEIKHGFKLFFINQPKKAEQFFKGHVDVPLFAMGYAAIRWLWSLLTLDQEDFQIGIAAAKDAELIAQEQLKQFRSSSWFGGTRPSEDNMTPEHVFYDVMETEAMLLGAILHIMSGSVIGKIRAGITIRTVWQRYSRIEKLCHHDDGQPDPIHMETRAAIEFGVGTFNLVCSILPPKILAIVKVLGFPTSRALGLRNLKASFDRGSVVSPLAGLGLLMHNTFLQATYDFGTAVYRDAAEDILRVAADRYPDSGWFYMFEGRFARLLRDNTRSIDAFYSARERQSEWPPLVDMCNYEVGFTSMMQYDYETALAHWLRLRRENDWSKAFYSYMAGACLQQLGRDAEALAMFNQIHELPVLKLHNGRIPVDIFVTRRVQQRVTASSVDLPLAHLEILFVWAAFYHMDRQALERAWTELIQAELELQPNIAVYNKSLLLLLRGALCSQLGRFDEACQCFDQLEGLRKNLKDEVWHIYYARYEQAMVWYKQDGEASQRVKDKLAKATTSKEHNWDTRLHLRVSTVSLGIQATCVYACSMTEAFDPMSIRKACSAHCLMVPPLNCSTQAKYHAAHHDELGLDKPIAGLSRSLTESQQAPEKVSIVPESTHDDIQKNDKGTVNLDLFLTAPEPPTATLV